MSLTEQPMPIPNGSLDVQSMVIEDIRKRREVGIERYGTALQPHNGRDALRDAYEEALDLACYLRQAMAERDGEQRAPVRYWCLVAEGIQDSLQLPPGLRMVRPGDAPAPSADGHSRWCLFEDDQAPPELHGKRVELTLRRGRTTEDGPYETAIERRVVA
jgi:hypothetical protein